MQPTGPDLTTVTGCLQAGNFSQAYSVAGEVDAPDPSWPNAMSGAIDKCVAAEKALDDAVEAAVSVAAGN